MTTITVPAIGTETQRHADEVIAAVRTVCLAQAMRDAATPPNGCSFCGAERRGHWIRFGAHRLVGDGTYILPTDGQRLDRMLARRASATGSLDPAVERLLARRLPPCCICRERPSTHAGECARCFSIGIELDGRYER